MSMRYDMLLIATVLCLLLSATSGNLWALPFNDDMVDNQLRTGSLMRQKVKESVPVGSLASRVESKDEAKALLNPIKADPLSTASGQRLFAVNCFPCHGDISKSPYQPGPVSRFLPGPDLSQQAYHDTPGGKSDGFIFATIHFGGALMPAVGYKLSAQEHWDIINYIRAVQVGKGIK